MNDIQKSTKIGLPPKISIFKASYRKRNLDNHTVIRIELYKTFNGIKNNTWFILTRKKEIREIIF